jgi:DNA-binding LacI/PurR family transcriptional regulator
MDRRSRRPRIADVARVAGVSKTAVSFAFNSPERLAAGTATRIRQVAESLGYRPNPVARLLTQPRTMTLGVLTPQALAATFSNPFFGEFSAGVAEVAERLGYELHFISPLHGSLALAVGRATVDGVVAIGLSASHPEVGQIEAAGLPMVLVDSDDLPDHGSVVVDDEAGAREAAEHLLALGHRDVVVLAMHGPAGSDEPGDIAESGVTARRLRGYRAAFAAASVALSPARVVAGLASIEGGADAFRQAWAAGRRPTGVLAMSDAMAIGAMGAARDLGVVIPRDLSVVGFDDIDIAGHVEPPLTTVHQPIREKGAEAARLLLAGIERREPRADAPPRVRLPTRLVVRASTAPPQERPASPPPA